MNLQSYPNCSLDIFVQNLFASVNKLIHERGIPTCFELDQVPRLSLDKYITRVVNFIPCTVESFIISIAYLYRISQHTPYLINTHSVHILFITSLLVASKYNDDRYYNNKYYARVGGISYLTLNKLEIEFLKYVNFECYVSLDEFKKFIHIINIQDSKYYSISPSKYYK